MGLARKHSRRRMRGGRERGHEAFADIGEPLILLLAKPKIEDIPVGATLRPGELLLWIQTPPVFGKNGDERREFRFPVHLGKNVELSQANALLAFDLLISKSAVVRGAVEDLKALARTPAARKWAAENFPRLHDTHTLE